MEKNRAYLPFKRVNCTVRFMYDVAWRCDMNYVMNKLGCVETMGANFLNINNTRNSDDLILEKVN